MSIQRTCRHCGRRLHGTTPGAMVIMLDGQPIEASIVLCTEGAIDVRRALDQLLNRVHRRAVAEHAQRLDLARRAPADAITEHFSTLPRSRVDATTFDQEAHCAWPPRVVAPDARLPVPLTRERDKRPTSLLGWRRQPR